MAETLMQRYPVPTEESAAYVLFNKLVMKGVELAKFIQQFNQQAQRLGSGDLGLQAMLQEVFLSGMPNELRQLVEQSRPKARFASLAALQSMAATLQQTRHLRNTDNASDSRGSQQSGTAGRKRSADRQLKKQAVKVRS